MLLQSGDAPDGFVAAIVALMPGKLLPLTPPSIGGEEVDNALDVIVAAEDEEELGGVYIALYCALVFKNVTTHNNNSRSFIISRHLQYSH